MEKEPINITPAESLEALQQGHDRTWERLYDRYRGEFMTWLRQQGLHDMDLQAELYQRSVTLLFLNVRRGRLTHLQSSVKTYLFGIGKNLLRQHWDRTQLESQFTAEWELPLGPEVMAQYEQAHQQAQVKSLLASLGEPCKSVLELFYLQHFSVEAIAHRLNYKNARGVSKRKSLCLAQLRQLFSLTESSRSQ